MLQESVCGVFLFVNLFALISKGKSNNHESCFNSFKFVKKKKNLSKTYTQPNQKSTVVTWKPSDFNGQWIRSTVSLKVFATFSFQNEPLN